MAQIVTDLLRYRISIAAQEGADPADILAHAKVDPDLMATDRERYDASVERSIWQAIVELTGREDIGLLCGNRFPTQVISVLGYVMANAPNLGMALEKISRYQRVLGDTMGMQLEHQRNRSTLSIELWSKWFDPLRYTVDMMISAAVSWAEHNTLDRVRPTHVGLCYRPPSNTVPYEDLFAPAVVVFGCERSYLIYPRSAMDAQILGANTAMFEHFDAQAKLAAAKFDPNRTTAFKVSQHILGSLTGDTPTINNTARKLSVSVRNLQQSLKDEGESFSSLLSQARMQLALQYLKQAQISHSEIAYLLGYSEVSVFSRSFKKWTGYSPSEFSTRRHQKISNRVRT